MLQLLHHCSIVITDSGGLQKEAYFFKKFSVVLREQTEWVELLNNGFASSPEVIQKKLLILHISCCKLHLLIKQVYMVMVKQGKKSQISLNNIPTNCAHTHTYPILST